MCGRYTIMVTIEELMLRFMLDRPLSRYEPRYNVAPGQMIMAIIHDGERRRAGELQWGLIPNWAKDGGKSRFMNARAESLTERAAFRLPFERKRCIVPADGYYEWRKMEDGSKRPMRIALKSGGLFGMAGLYDTWTAPDGSKISTCAIITTEPNELLAAIHDRMPAILRPEDEARWLSRDERDTAALAALLGTYPAELMHAYPVHPMVGNVRNDVAACVEEWRG